ncbi:hypothetical protein LAZ67_5002864 [Cordylochernes scorpioides]|uniref:Tc1-like transposase DDE domain-containing protein n=1 Tax=Cordylochernes scorpioides TaxID=51811 RepID=A0ABY6KH07_9ARAC|nr:hypothetical protein LAZ67_5002864 [Cordylochernes scorpioides]
MPQKHVTSADVTLLAMFHLAAWPLSRHWTDTWLFHHDNAPAHRSKVSADDLAHTGLKLMEHPPYSPDLNPCDFSLFPHVKNRLKGKIFFCNEDLLMAWDELYAKLFEETWKSWFDDWFLKDEEVY